MKFGSRQFGLPFLIGLSLTGVSATLLYLLLKKDEDDDANNSRTTRLVTSRQNILELKVPRQFVPVLIGRGGMTIKDIENKTETRINFAEDDPEVPDRVCIIRGKTECIRFAQLMIENIIANQPVIETYELYVPQRACGRIIGLGGECVKQIQTASNAKVLVESSGNNMNLDAKRRIIVKGTAEQIASAVALIEDKVREENEMRGQLDFSSSSRTPRGKVSSRNTVVNTSEKNQSRSTESLTTSGSEGLMEVYVSAMETPSQFWVQVVGPGALALDKLVTEMTEYYNNKDNKELHQLKNITPGQMVAAKFSYDKQWYRAEVIAQVNNDTYEVYFVDYGDSQKLALKDMMEIRTDFLSLRLQAIECSLANVKPRDGEWSNDACDRFADLSWLAQWKSLTAKVRGYRERVLGQGSSRREGSPVPCVDLYDKSENGDINIGKELVNEMIAEEDGSWSTASSTSTLSLSRRNNREVSSPSPLSPVQASTPPPTNASRPRENVERHEESSAEGMTETNSIPPPTNASRPEENAERHEESSVEGMTETNSATPKKLPYNEVEIVDLVTPVKNSTNDFVAAERNNGFQENGSGDHLRNGIKSADDILKMERQNQAKTNILPGGFEDDISEDSDNLELG